MKKTVAFLLCIVFAFGLCSCGKDDGAPDGMMLCAGGENLGYNFYVPEEWTLSNFGNISAAYVSNVNPTSVSLAEGTMGSYTSLADYFNGHISDFPYTITVVNGGQSVKLGNADSAMSFIYTFTYNAHAYRTLQILATVGERFFIFTYNAQDETYMDSENTYYEEFMDKALSVMENVNFIGKNEAPSSILFDTEGFAKVSEKKKAGFDFYMTEGWNLDESSGIVKISKPDGASVVLSEATVTGVEGSEYWETRKLSLEPFVENLTEIEKNVYLTVANGCSSAKYEYTYLWQGEEFHVLQYLIIGGSRGYVFTYTAKSADFDTHKADVEVMLGKLVF